MKNKFLEVCIGIAIILFAIGFFFRSFTTVQAAPLSPNDFKKAGTNSIGKYQLSLAINTVSSGFSEYAIILDTETGESRSYYCSKGTSWKWKLEDNQLPSEPFADNK